MTYLRNHKTHDLFCFPPFQLILLSFAVFFCSINSTAYADFKKGVLLRPFDADGITKGEPGQIVYYSTSQSGRPEKLKINNEIFDSPGLGVIVPYDHEFTPSRIFVEFLEPEPRTWDQDYLSELKRRYLLSFSMAKNFPGHRLADDFNYYSCNYSRDYEECETDGKTDFKVPIACYRKYLKKFRNGKYKDRAEWEIVKLVNFMYEYEGYADGPISQIKAYEAFLRKHPRSRVSEEIKFEIAQLSRIAYESIRYEKEIQTQYTDNDANEYYRKALKLYAHLSKSKNIELREKAAVEHYNLLHNRRTYINPNEW